MLQLRKKPKSIKSKYPVQLVDDMNFVLDNLNLPIIVLDAKARVRKFNQPWLGMFGVKNKTLKDYKNKDYFQLLNSFQKRKIYTSKIKSKIENILQNTIDGDIKAKFLEFSIGGKWYLNHMHPVHRDGSLKGFIITHHDVTIWKKKELELQKQRNESFENSQRKMFFLANLNHELKSPLNSIMGFSQLLNEQIKVNGHAENYSQLIENILEGASHLKSIVFRILNMAKIESGTLLLQEERVMPATLIQSSINLIKPLFPNRKVSVDICEQAKLETLKCDKNLAMEVIMNLLVNSLKFSKDDILLKCCVDKNKNLEFTVVDQGIGMTRDEIDVALEPFGQNIRSPSDKDTGLGLGVPFSCQIMKLHGGELRISSEKGKGTNVSAIFPSNRIEF